MSAPVKHHAALAARLAEVEAKAVRDRIEIEALTDERDEARTWLAKRARSLRGFNEVNDVDPEQAVKIAEDEAIEWRDRAKEVESERDALAARLAEVEAENARLRELALVEAEGQHDEMLGATGLRPGEIALHLTKRKRWF